jgi:hypothetical protein
MPTDARVQAALQLQSRIGQLLNCGNRGHSRLEGEIVAFARLAGIEVDANRLSIRRDCTPNELEARRDDRNAHLHELLTLAHAIRRSAQSNSQTMPAPVVRPSQAGASLSPFAIPEPQFQFAGSEPVAPRALPVGLLIKNLASFATFYGEMNTAIENADVFGKRWLVGGRDANAADYVRNFRATIGIDRVRGYVYAQYGEELTLETARRLLGDLVKSGLTLQAAEAMTLEPAIDRLESLAADQAKMTAHTRQEPLPVSKPKKSTQSGEAEAKLISFLTKHHQYADGGCLNQEPIGNNELARNAVVSPSTANAFFVRHFGGYDQYKYACADNDRLIASLRLLNGELAPRHFLRKEPEAATGQDD